MEKILLVVVMKNVNYGQYVILLLYAYIYSVVQLPNFGSFFLVLCLVIFNIVIIFHLILIPLAFHFLLLLLQILNCCYLLISVDAPHIIPIITYSSTSV